jgi:NAD-dependent SIR2 family protein deacetylase
MNSESELRKAFRQELDKSKHLVILTGAGVSAESGIPTFRGEGGLWRNFNAQVRQLTFSLVV